MSWVQWAPYVPVAQRRANALREISALREEGKDIQPIRIEGRTIARSFWGKGWCDHLESFSDFENRLPRRRTYVRNGSVCHLSTQPGRTEALVGAPHLHNTTIRTTQTHPPTCTFVRNTCPRRICPM